MHEIDDELLEKLVIDLDGLGNQSAASCTQDLDFTPRVLL